MTWDDPIAGGSDGTLIRQSLESKGFITNVSGWRVSRDGSAEFQNGVFRGSLEADGANNSYVKMSTTGGTGFGTAYVAMRPPDLPLINTSEINQAQLFSLSFQPGGAGIIPSAFLTAELDCAQWSFGSTAVDKRYPTFVMQTASHDGTVHPSALLSTSGPVNAATFDIALNGTVSIGSGRLKGGASCLMSVAPAVVMASGTSPNLQTLNSLDDAFNMFDNVSTVTLPYTGVYEIGYYGTFSAQATAAGYRALQIALNGATFRRQKLPTSTSVNNEILSPQMIFRQAFFAGDTITFFAFQNSGANLNFSADMWVELIRPTT
jgi:hypothetical protein